MSRHTTSLLLILASLLSVLWTTNAQAQGTGNPIIGVLTVPSDYSPEYPATNYSYIPSSYVKHLWAGGARVVPVQYDLPQEQLYWLFERINGLLIPGGGIAFAEGGQPNEWALSAEYLIGLAMDANIKGDFFPVMGTCLGYQVLTSVMAQNWTNLIHVHSGNNISKNVFLTDNGIGNSMYTNMPGELIDLMESNNISFFHHNNTPDPRGWEENEFLKSSMQVLAWTEDYANNTYAASVGGIDLPFWGTQFHPEKETYEWWVEEGIPHTHNAIEYEQYFGNFFVNQSRLSDHAFDTDVQAQEFDIQIMNAQFLPGPFETVYFYTNVNSTESQEDTAEYRHHHREIDYHPHFVTEGVFGFGEMANEEMSPEIKLEAGMQVIDVINRVFLYIE